MWVCGKELEQDEYLWGIDPSQPHEHGEPQDHGPIEVVCNCTPAQITESEFDRRRQAIFDELQLDL